MTELRCYTFTIFQLSTIQQGIQAGHAAVELTRRGHDLTMDWAENHKTFVWLNAGTYGDLLRLIQFLQSKENPYPWASFAESEEFLGGLTTSVAIVLPERIFKIGPQLNTGKLSISHDKIMGVHRVLRMTPQVGELSDVMFDEYTEWEWGLIERLAATSLAR